MGTKVGKVTLQERDVEEEGSNEGWPCGKVKWLDGEVEEMDGGDWLNVGWLVKGKSSG